MPYIATDLDAFDDAQAVAGSTGLPFQHVLGGLQCVWRWCWRQKTDRVTAEQLAALFGSTVPGLAGVLVAFGFLAVHVTAGGGDGAYRVRGVDRYLRLSEARRRGGLAAKGNLVPGARQRRKSLGTSPEAAQSVPGISSGSKNLAGSARAAPQAGDWGGPTLPAEADPGWHALVADLFAAFEADRGVKYDPNGRDWKALKGLVRHGAAEVLRRWKIGLQARYAARCSTFWDLGQRWNACAAPEASQGPSRGNSRVDPNAGIMTARRESAEEIEAANRRQEEWLDGR